MFTGRGFHGGGEHWEAGGLGAIFRGDCHTSAFSRVWSCVCAFQRLCGDALTQPRSFRPHLSDVYLFAWLLCYLLLVHILLFPLSGLREVLDVPILKNIYLCVSASCWEIRFSPLIRKLM